jgi:hypothetical protein
MSSRGSGYDGDDGDVAGGNCVKGEDAAAAAAAAASSCAAKTAARPVGAALRSSSGVDGSEVAR